MYRSWELLIKLNYINYINKRYNHVICVSCIVLSLIERCDEPFSLKMTIIMMRIMMMTIMMMTIMMMMMTIMNDDDHDDDDNDDEDYHHYHDND